MDSSNIELSIIIVNWNTRDVLRDCLASVMGQANLEQTEVFVVDNGSSDGSPEMVCAEFPNARLIANQENRGFAAANNQAIVQATGRFILLLNSDTVVLGDVLQESVEYLKLHSDVGVFGCRVLNSDGSVQLTCSRFPSLLNLMLLASGLFRCRWPRVLGRYQLLDWKRDDERDVETVTGCYMLVRRSAIETVGLLDESFFFYGEETDWCRRFAQAGWKLRFAPVGEIIHYGSLSSRKCSYRRDLMLTSGLIRVHRKHSGVIGAALAWLVLLAFQILRAGFWTVRSWFAPRREVVDRRNHFWRVLAEFRSTWPRMEEGVA